MAKKTSSIKPGALMFVLVDPSWIAGPAGLELVKIVLGAEGPTDWRKSEPGLILFGEMLQSEYTPGLVLRVIKLEALTVEEPTEIMIPWNQVLWISTQKNWSPQEAEKRFGFASTK